MNKHTILRRLRVLQPLANAISPRLNYGGCAVFAGIVGERLRALDIEVDCVVERSSWSGFTGTSISDVRNTIRKRRLSPFRAPNWTGNGLGGFPHVGVRFTIDGETYVYDSESLHKGGDRLGSGGVHVYKDGLTVDECIGIASRREGWNESFDRSAIPALKAVAGAVLTP